MTTVRTATLAQAYEDAVGVYRQRTWRSAAQFAESCAVLAGGNTRSNLHTDPYPVLIDQAHGAELIDVDGHRYLDFNSDYTVAIHGHTPTRLLEVATAQMARGVSWGGRSQAETALASAVLERVPMMDRVRFTNSGTEANLFALMTVMDLTSRSRILVVDGGYHGSMFTFVPAVRRFNLSTDVVAVPFNDIGALEVAFATHGSHLAGAFTELMLNSGGCIPASPEWVGRLAQLCADHGVLLVVDEVMTARLGFHGLTGRFGVTPDLVTLGKFIGGGFPIGAVAGPAHIMDRFDMRRPDGIAHGGSFNNEIFSMVCGHTALTEMLGPAVMAEFNARGDLLRVQLNEVFTRHDVALVMSGFGSTMALHPGRSAPMQYHRDPQADLLRKWFHLELANRGLWVAGRAMIATNLAHTEAHFDQLLAAVDDVVGRHCEVLRD